MFRWLFSLLVVVFFVCTTAPASTIRQARLDSRSGQVSLLFNDKLEQLFGHLIQWEAKLAGQGIRARFFVGAGDLRRAILHMPMDGPGDVELFIHLENREVRPLKLHRFFRFLGDHGADVVGTMSGIFGKEKHLDLFVKDRVSFASGLPYFGELGYFENMGDTSLNQLLYSPVDNAVYGTPETLDALARKRILFTEAVKAAPLNERQKLTGSEAMTGYPDTILRMALRSIRLRLDLLLAPNPNKLRLDAGFKNVLRGFELFFRKASEEDISRYPMDAAYIEQFQKIFRNRSNAELAAIHSFFTDELPKTYSILRALGLDVDLLCRRRTRATDLGSLELRAVINNARYDALRPFVTRGGAVRNPYSDPGPEARTVPAPILKRYDPKLAAYVENFDQLTVEEQLWTIKAHLKAVRYFAKDATTRILKETTFREELLPSFSFLDLDRLKDQGALPLREFIEQQLDAADVSPAVADREFNAPMIAAIEQRLETAQKTGKTPIIMVDLDDTLFLSNSRVAHLLRRYDELHGTRYFGPVSQLDMGNGDWRRFLRDHLESRISGFRAREELIRHVKEFVVAERFSAAAVAVDEVNDELRRLLWHWKDRFGTGFLYLTGRNEFLRAATEQSLAQSAVPFDPARDQLILKQQPGRTDDFKASELLTFRRAHPRLAIAAVLDNEPSNLAKIATAVPEALTVRVLLKPGTTELYLLSDDQALFKAYGTWRPGCEALLLPKKKARRKLSYYHWPVWETAAWA